MRPVAFQCSPISARLGDHHEGPDGICNRAWPGAPKIGLDDVPPAKLHKRCLDTAVRPVDMPAPTGRGAAGIKTFAELGKGTVHLPDLQEGVELLAEQREAVTGRTQIIARKIDHQSVQAVLYFSLLTILLV